MTILRKRVSARFTTVPNAAIEDDSLSFRARGILVYLLAKPDGWAVRSAQIAADGKEGRDAVRTALGELAAAGYYRHYLSRGDGGRISTVTRVSDVPMHHPEDDEIPGRYDPSGPPPAPGVVVTESGEIVARGADFLVAAPGGTPPTGDGFSGAGQPDAGQSGPLVKTLEQNPHKPPRGARDIPDSDPDWQRFWQAYPKRVGKGAARRAWVRAIRKAPPAVIMAGLAVYADVVKTLEGERFIQHPATWLNQERWTDERPTAEIATGGRPRNVRDVAEECPTHAGQHRDRCGGCAADARAVERPVNRSQVGNR